MNDENPYDDALGKSTSLFKRGFELSPSIGMGQELETSHKARLCRACFQKFVPMYREFGQHVCPNCRNRQSA